MTFFSLRLTAALPLTLALIGSACAVPVNGAGAPFQADLPAGWAQRAYPNKLPGLSVMTPGTPPSVALLFFYPPYKSVGKDKDAADLKEFMAGVEEGNEQISLKMLSERPLTVGGVRGTERKYAMTFKANNSVVQTQIWYGVTPKNLLQFQVIIGAKATPAQTAIFGKVLSTVKFK